MRGTQLRLFIVFFCTAGSVLLLQSAFDRSDHQKAEKAVRNYAIGGRTLGEIVEAQAPGGAWGSEITSGCRGIVRVTYVAEAQKIWQFDYDVPQHGIHPGNETGKAALEELIAKQPAFDGGVDQR